MTDRRFSIRIFLPLPSSTFQILERRHRRFSIRIFFWVLRSYVPDARMSTSIVAIHPFRQIHQLNNIIIAFPHTSPCPTLYSALLLSTVFYFNPWMAELVLHYTTLDNLILMCLFFVNFFLGILSVSESLQMATQLLCSHSMFVLDSAHGCSHARTITGTHKASIHTMTRRTKH